MKRSIERQTIKLDYGDVRAPRTTQKTQKPLIFFFFFHVHIRNCWPANRREQETFNKYYNNMNEGGKKKQVSLSLFLLSHEHFLFALCEYKLTYSRYVQSPQKEYKKNSKQNLRGRAVSLMTLIRQKRFVGFLFGHLFSFV